MGAGSGSPLATGDRARPRRDDADDLPAGVGSREQLTHGTFEDYCRERWGWNADYGRKLIHSAETVGVLTDTAVSVLPASERHARELVPLMREAPEQVAEAWHPSQLGRQQLLHELMDPRDPDGWLSVFESVRGRHDSWRP